MVYPRPSAAPIAQTRGLRPLTASWLTPRPSASAPPLGSALSAGFEPLLEERLVLRNLLGRIAARERREQLSEQTMAGEVERERDTGTAAARLDGNCPERPYRPVNNAERRLAWRIVLRQLVGELARHDGDAPRLLR